MSELNQKEVNEQMYLFVKRWLDDLPFEERKKIPVMAIGYCLARLSKQDELLKEHEERIKNRDESLEKAREEIKWLRGMLKEQEATMVIESENMYTGLPITHCPKCGISLDRYLYGRQYEGQINYCPMCGQAVKWE